MVASEGAHEITISFTRQGEVLKVCVQCLIEDEDKDLVRQSQQANMNSFLGTFARHEWRLQQ